MTTALVLAVANTPAFAQSDLLSKDRFQVRVRALGVLPDESSSVNIGGEVKVSNTVVPEIDLTYFLTDHIAAELIAATTHHKLSHSSGADLGETWVLPPTLTLQYHFTPDQAFSPYVGAGLNYTMFYNEDTAAGFTNLKVDSGVGYALQAGADYWLDDHWGLNLDVKKLFLNVDAELNNGAVKADVDLDPWLIGAGVSYRF
jgi:outer membrane protein